LSGIVDMKGGSMSVSYHWLRCVHPDGPPSAYCEGVECQPEAGFSGRAPSPALVQNYFLPINDTFGSEAPPSLGQLNQGSGSGLPAPISPLCTPTPTRDQTHWLWPIAGVRPTADSGLVLLAVHVALGPEQEGAPILQVVETEALLVRNYRDSPEQWAFVRTVMPRGESRKQGLGLLGVMDPQP
jgi:hypothetical protein